MTVSDSEPEHTVRTTDVTELGLRLMLPIETYRLTNVHAYLCTRCGVPVIDVKGHEQWHATLQQAMGLIAGALETLGGMTTSPPETPCRDCEGTGIAGGTWEKYRAGAYNRADGSMMNVAICHCRSTATPWTQRAARDGDPVVLCASGERHWDALVMERLTFTFADQDLPDRVRTLLTVADHQGCGPHTAWKERTTLVRWNEPAPPVHDLHSGGPT